MQLCGWRVEWCLWMFMCVCVWICEVFMKKARREVKKVMSDKCLVVPGAFYLFKLSPYVSPLFLSSWCFPPSLQFHNSLCISSHPAQVYCPYFLSFFSSPPCKHYTLWSAFFKQLFSFFSQLLPIKRISPTGFLMVMKALTEDYQTHSHVHTQKHQLLSVSPCLCIKHTHKHGLYYWWLVKLRFHWETLRVILLPLPCSPPPLQ